jgi:predicted esterase
MTDTRTITVRTHGRYLVEAAKDRPRALIVGFHGYAEPAEDQLRRLKSIPDSERLLLVSVQALNRFYRRRTQDVIASWMTRQDRDLAIVDNLAYVSGVLDAVLGEWPYPAAPILYAGFSQGAAMAYRAACARGGRPGAVIALGGDVPPELDQPALARVPAVLLGRGARDDWYTQEKMTADESRLQAAGVNVRAVTLDAGHEWTETFSREAARFIDALLSTRQSSVEHHRK